jgi:hypothetical protein
MRAQIALVEVTEEVEEKDDRKRNSDQPKDEAATHVMLLT